MDKNMINIDDLFRQRLGGAEEKERPGAWLQMRELLDKEMPVQAPGNAMNWRRMFGMVAGLLIVASATIGGYRAITSSVTKNDKQVAAVTSVADNTPSHTKTSAPAKTAVPNTNATDNKTVAKNDITGKGQQTNGTLKNTPKRQQPETKTAAVKQPKTQQTVTNQVNKTSEPKQVTATVAANKTTKTVTNSNNKEASASASNTAKKENSNSDKKLINNKLDNNSATVASNDKAVKTANNQDVSPAANNTKADNKANVTVNEKLSSGNTTSSSGNTVPAIKTAANTTSSVTSNAGAKPAQSANKNEVAKNTTAPKQLVDKIQTKESYDRKTGAWKQDTIDKGKMEWAGKEELMAMKGKDVDNTNAEITPASGATVKTANNAEQLVPLSNFRTSSKNQNYQTHNIFEEMVKNAKMQLGGVKFYPGLVFGVNTALSGTNSMSGFQAGVNGTLSLNEKWGITAELKFVERFKSGSRESNRNDYMSDYLYDASKNTYSWVEHKHYFTYPNVASMEMPIMMRYSIRRVNLLLGTNLIYNFAFSPSQSDEGNTVTSTSTQGYKPTTEAGAILSPKDFSSRFGVGYLFGVGYQISPAIQLDARMTQSLWDNASTPGEEKVSKEVYQLPTLQLNFSYRFSSNKYKPYRQY